MQLYLENWYDKLLAELPLTVALRIISPFVKEQIIRTAANQFNFEHLELITRYNLADFACNASSLDALYYAVSRGAAIYGIRGLHSKVYLFDRRGAIVTSANFTAGGLINNYECGIYVTDPAIIEQLHRYADRLKNIAGDPLTIEMCDRWRAEVAGHTEVHNSFIPSLPDHGATVRRIDPSKNYYVKFFGEASNRVEFDFSVKEEVDRALCHYACCFSQSKRPRQINTGDIVYMGRMTSPNDFAIFGKAEAIKHLPGRDEATEEEIAERDWKEDWPLYVRVRNTQFIDGVMADCPLLYDLIKSLDYQSFASTRRRYLAGERAIHPSLSLSQQPYVRLTLEGAQWVEERFQQALQRCGQIDNAFLQNLPAASIDAAAL